MIDKLYKRASAEVIALEKELEKFLGMDTKDTAPEFLWPLYQKIEVIIDRIVKLRARRQFIVNNLISDIGEMEEYERKKTTISSRNITTKQWTNLLIELNLIVQDWKPYARLELQAPGLKKIIAFGRKTGDDKETRRTS